MPKLMYCKKLTTCKFPMVHGCQKYECFEPTEKPKTDHCDTSNSSELLKTREWLNNEFRMIISHRLLGYDCDIEVEDWEGMLDSLVDAACKKLGGC